MNINVTLSCDPDAQKDVEEALGQMISVNTVTRMISAPSFEFMNIRDDTWENVQAVVGRGDREAFFSLLRTVVICTKEEILAQLFSDRAGRDIKILVNMETYEAGGPLDN